MIARLAPYLAPYSSKTIRAATRPASTSAIDSLIVESDRVSRMTARLARSVQLEHLAQIRPCSTIEPTTVIPFRTVSKIGSSIVFSAGNATKTSVPPRRNDP